MTDKHANIAAKFIRDEKRTDWHNQAVWNFRQKRDLMAHSIPEWEVLRTLASDIKSNVLGQLDEYLLEFEKNAEKNGVQIHWASDAASHNKIVGEILDKHNITHVVKSKSMLTEECGLNNYLEQKGVEVIDTDLGERIIQLRDEPPSHIIAPAIHLKKQDISDTFHKELNTEKGNVDPTYLTRSARQHLREKFLNAQAGITGGNFAIAENGSIVVVTNEGNADFGVNIPPIQIHCIGIEKIIPKWEHLGIFTRLLAASATGQKLSVYTSHYSRPKPGGEMHVVLVDNGRTAQLGREDYRNSLKCIRCSACLNTCPVYRRSGGHSYHSAISGPIGSIFMPGKDLDEYCDLPMASSLCGSCTDVCPVKINIHEQLYRWRQNIGQQGLIPKLKMRVIKKAAMVLSDSKSFEFYSKMARMIMNWTPRFLLYNKLNVWGKHRDLPKPPKESFRKWYQKNRDGNE